MGEFPRKILVSPGFGAGWSTWDGDDNAQFACEYQPIIEFLEGGGKFVEKPWTNDPNHHEHPWEQFEEPGASILRKFLEDLAAHRGEEVYFYLGGADDLVVETVHSPYRVIEYDGHESVEIAGDIGFIH